MLEAATGIINILESGEKPDEEKAENLLEVLVVKCARWYDFTLRDDGDDFFAQALSRLFDGVVRKWILKPNWLKCPRDENYSSSYSSEERKASNGGSSCSPRSESYARPGLLLNVLQLVRLFTRDCNYRKQLVCDADKAESLGTIAQFLAWRSRAHFEEKWLLPSGKEREAMSTPLGREMLVECVSIVRRLATDKDHCEALFSTKMKSQVQAMRQRRQGNQNNQNNRSDHMQEFGIAGTLALLLHTTDNAILPLAIDSLTHIAERMNDRIDDWDEAARGPKLSREEKLVIVDTLRHVSCCGIEVILKMIESYSRPFNRLAATLLTTLLSLEEVRTQVLVDQYKSGSGGQKKNRKVVGSEPMEGAPLIQRLVSKFSYCERELYVPILNVLSVILQENFLISDLRDVGGIPIILNSIRTETFAGKGKEGDRLRASMDFVCAVSRCIQVMSIDDEASYQVKQCNGVYLLGRCLVQPWDPADPDFFHDNSPSLAANGWSQKGGGAANPLTVYNLVEASRVHLARAHVLRALRYIFSSERNRDIFKKLMPPDFFSAFIDVGHYQESLKPYLRLAELMHESEVVRSKDQPREEAGPGDDGAAVAGAVPPSSAEDSGLNNLQSPRITHWTRVALKEIDKNSQNDIVKIVNGYHFVELLGKGAFGSVYKARKKGFSAHEEKICAVKELALEDVHIFGATKKEQEEAKAAIAEEMKILSEMDHPGIVHYYESFEKDGKVYIAMEYAGGMSLEDRIRSLEARNQRSSETEVWQILTQLCLALRYMHQDKEIVHRDLTPANIIISLGNDIVTVGEASSDQPLTVRITDFGYAKRKEEGGFVMRSLVGTITFCCPEIVQHQVYTDKADVWSLGCILYNVMLLKPPFSASNIFNIAQKIVEGQFDPPIESDKVPWYSSELKRLVGRMLTVDPEKRPSIGEIIVEISSRVARETDSMRSKIRLLEEEIHMERKYFVREKRIAMKTQNALEKANSASSISSIMGLEDGSLFNGAASYGNTVAAGAGSNISANGDLESPKLVPLSQSMAAKAPLNLQPNIGKLSTLSTLSNAPGQSTKTKISIPQRNLRVLTDPVIDMLTQVHKLMLVAQLPPSLDLHADGRRQFLQRVHLHLFASDQRAGAIKAHLAKLVEQSEDPIDGLGLHETISYAHVHTMLEDILKETNIRY
ncbi:serine/threonine protein kinase [Chloropicon primus]|uniref:non-specific serine/threonine protein kinase n=1 Tax=Chloropicon primus TaxID=1764295 RepID=A0A5B8N1E9_9CHLO|nr:serine/threonine protein kinase [Chloropicon primus]|eukprot:QDZ26116.1 serine/threonine protein kinase [Chloropicon primus]